MKKCFIHFAVALALCFSMIIVFKNVAHADSESDFVCSFENGQATITGYLGQGGDVVIPDEIDGCSVVGIGNNVFVKGNNITSIMLPDSLSSIEDYSFSNLYRMRSISINASNLSFSSQDGVLYNKDMTRLLRYPMGRNGTFIIPSSVEGIAAYAFYYCTGLTNIEIPDRVNDIGQSAFESCTGLVSINLPNGIVDINEDTFHYCYSLKNVYFPDSVKNIRIGAFSNCDMLTSLIIPENVESINVFSFYDCDSLSSIEVDTNNCFYTSQDGILYNNDMSVLILCPSGKSGSITIPDSVTEITGGGFLECRKLTSVVLSNNLINISEGSFEFCNQLKTIEIPNSVTMIEKNAITNCPSLRELIFAGAMPIIQDDVLDQTSSLAVFYYHITCAETWNTFNNIEYKKQAYCNVTIDLADGSNPYQTQRYVYNKHIIDSLDTPQRDNYTFKGWFKDSSCTAVWNFQVDQISTDIIIYAKWEPNSYTVSFNFQYGSDTSSVLPVKADYNTKIQEPNTPERQGYTLTGWFKEQKYQNKWDFENNAVTGNITLYAQWTAETINVTLYYQDDTTPSSSMPVTYDAVYGLPSPKRIGYDFVGWFTNPDDPGTEIKATTKMTSTSAQTLYAKWAAKTYTVALDYQDKVTPYSNITVIYGSQFGDQLSSPLRIGYTFGGWFTGKGGLGTQITPGTKVTVAGTQTLYAQWTAETINVTLYYQDDTTPSSSMPVTYDALYELPKPKRTGYDFVGWFKNPDDPGTEIKATTKMTSTSAQTLYAKWAAKTYVVALDYQDKVTPSLNITVIYGSLFGDQLSAPLRIGYTFGGWFTEKGGLGTQITPESKDTDAGIRTLYACWSAQTYTVTLDYQDGKTVSSKKAVTFASDYGSLPSPSRTGYKFAGWYTGKNGSGDKITATTKITTASNHTLYAKWTVDPIPSCVNAVSCSCSSIRVSWAAVPNAKGYEVSCATARAGYYASVGMPTGTSLLAASLTIGKTYYFKVRSYTLSGSTKIYSGDSVIACAVPKPAIPANLKAARASSSSIKLTWGKVAGATKYEIWRCTSVGGDYSLLATTSSAAYLNTKLTAGKTYYYEVRAYCQVKKTKVYGDYSVVASAKP